MKTFVMNKSLFQCQKKFSKKKKFLHCDVENVKLRKEENEKLRKEESEKLRKEESENLRKEESEKLRKEESEK